MRLISAGAPRAAWHDRNAATKNGGVDTQLSEATTTTEQASYTVPSGKKAQVGMVSGSLTQEVASTTTTAGNYILADASLTPSGGSLKEIGAASLNAVAAAAGDRATFNYGPTLVLVEGDKLSLRATYLGTSSGAGRTRLVMGLAVTEFDA